jgi:hypothetical protein
LLTLAYSDQVSRDVLFRPPALAIAGTSIAWAVETKDDAPDFSEGGRITVIRRGVFYPKGSDPRFHGWYGGDATTAGSPKDSQVGSLVVNRQGAAAWITCPPTRRSAPRSCERPGHRDTVYSAAPGSIDREFVARGRDIDPSSLRRRGRKFSWLQGGRRRSATLPSS